MQILLKGVRDVDIGTKTIDRFIQALDVSMAHDNKAFIENKVSDEIYFTELDVTLTSSGVDRLLGMTNTKMEN